MKKMNILFSPPDITQIEIDKVVEVLKSGWITTGSKTKLFENKLSEYCNTDKTVTMNSATACMSMTLKLLGIGPGDEVITSSYTYTASASVIDHIGAKIVLVDTAKNSFEMDYDKLENLITNKTKAIIPVDIGGVMCDYDKIFEIVNNKKDIFKPSPDTLQEEFGRIIVIGDAAHSFGAENKGRKSGSVADFTCFSFHAVKNLTTAEGGAVTWKKLENVSSESIYTNYMRLILHGQTKDALSKTQLGAWEYDIVAPYYKFNMTDINAAIGLGQLERYESLLKRRKHIIEKYDESFKDLPVKTLQHFIPGSQSSGHLYLIRFDVFDEEKRNELIIKLASKGITANVHYKPLPMLTAYRNLGFKIQDYPNAFELYQNEVSLPLHTLLTDEEVNYICEMVKLCYKEIINDVIY